MQVVWRRLLQHHETLAPSLPSHDVLARTDDGQTQRTWGLLGWQRNSDCNTQLTECSSIRRDYLTFTTISSSRGKFVNTAEDKYIYIYIYIYIYYCITVFIYNFRYSKQLGGNLGIRFDPILRTLGVWTYKQTYKQL